MDSNTTVEVTDKILSPFGQSVYDFITADGTGLFLIIYLLLGVLTFLIIYFVEVGSCYFKYYSKDTTIKHTVPFETYLTNHLDVGFGVSIAIVLLFPYFILSGIKELIVNIKFGYSIHRFIGRQLTKFNKYKHPENHI